MSEKRRGLGRGLGALIPTSSEGARPVDVFFPSSQGVETGKDAESEPESTAETATDVTGGGDLEGPGVVSVETDGSTDVTSFATVTIAQLEDLDHGELGTAGDDGAVAGKDSHAGPTISVGDSSGDGLSATGADATPVAPGVSRETPGDAHVADDVPADDSSSVEWTGGGADDLVPVPGARFAEVLVSAIRPNPKQPRTVFDETELDELVGSISEIGVLQPIVVRPVDGDPGFFELIMGERRWRATQAAGLASIPAIIRETDDSDLLRDALLENLHRSALNPLEEAAAYRQLLDDFGCTHDELATRISRSRPQISNTLRLLRLPPLVQRRVAAGVLSAGHARALLGLTDGAEIERLAQRIVAEGLSVRATEEIVAMGEREERAPRTPRAGQRSAAIDELATRLSDRFETRVKVDLGKNKGRLTVEFASVEDLNRILDLMAPQDPGLLRR
ncbi:ParB/RepB/Spo0J family partition protein [Cellulosimicrobium arenosum]|uniref:ParB/RepB/Spo0J family partition protein n=1 Tax=Cellulosimicrobium arenosum TaxID=2708133 RepID=A0A927J1A1_9MICO|nr:ParB/RepB/Spo0J family partition protein [Cellulosimicrobium arenosum]MBD8079978.1 ParB/RepB/Spo0J family partition protein [Cellulosimicrobium arenosum]